MNVFNSGKTWILALVLTSGQAHACLGPSFHTTIFFKQIPEHAQLALPVSIVSKEEVSRTRHLARATVGKAVRGNYHKDTITLVLPVEMDCGPHVKIGDTGIIVGKLNATGQMIVESTKVFSKPIILN